MGRFWLSVTIPLVLTLWVTNAWNGPYSDEDLDLLLDIDSGCWHLYSWRMLSSGIRLSSKEKRFFNFDRAIISYLAKPDESSCCFQCGIISFNPQTIPDNIRTALKVKRKITQQRYFRTFNENPSRHGPDFHRPQSQITIERGGYRGVWLQFTGKILLFLQATDRKIVLYNVQCIFGFYNLWKWFLQSTSFRKCSITVYRNRYNHPSIEVRTFTHESPINVYWEDGCRVHWIWLDQMSESAKERTPGNYTLG